MDEKSIRPPRRFGSASSAYRCLAIRRRFALAALLALGIIYLLLPFQPVASIRPFSRSLNSKAIATQWISGKDDIGLPWSEHKKVPLEAHIMSKCPDARDCLRDLVVPTMEQVADLVDFKLSFIGEIDQNDTLSCKHGPTECIGNMLALCADELYHGEPKVSLGFANCLISSYSDIPSRALVESCALEHAVDFDRLNKCVSDDGHGEELLRASVLRSKKADVVYSCTVRVNEDKWCIRDGGKWKDCKGGSGIRDLVDEIKKHSSK